MFCILWIRIQVWKIKAPDPQHWMQEAAEKLAVEKELLESDTSMLAEEKEKLLKEMRRKEAMLSREKGTSQNEFWKNVPLVDNVCEARPPRKIFWSNNFCWKKDEKNTYILLNNEII